MGKIEKKHQFKGFLLKKKKKSLTKPLLLEVNSTCSMNRILLHVITTKVF